MGTDRKFLLMLVATLTANNSCQYISSGRKLNRNNRWHKIFITFFAMQ